ncbi:hypothetical protein LTR84_012679 [Exophiala bonariae]|uniref:N-acetyltransferase domain-containing protein n=1 Tax=Exophiala bonariae TaxID=1690606 RepID=A0AAV9NIC8_9EURO|nr:hypothetical protein LTR84_012679 [Exophiala bonariae]
MATASVFSFKFTPQLQAHLSQLPPSVSLDRLSRLSPERLKSTALPNIGSIELVSSEAFDSVYDSMYVSMFPRREERERSDLIVDRLAAQYAGQREHLATYRIVGIRDDKGEAIGAAQFSVLPLPALEGEAEEGAKFAVPYLQYIYIRPQNRRQDMSEVLHTLVLAVSAADAAKDGRTVPFTLYETEPPGHGADEVSRAYASQRARIHANAGGVALVLRRQSDSSIISAHVQPGLEVGDSPLTLTWVIRPSPDPGREYDVAQIGRSLVAAYYSSLRDEGFPEVNIRLAETIVEKRYDGCEFHLMPLADVKDHVE